MRNSANTLFGCLSLFGITNYKCKISRLRIVFSMSSFIFLLLFVTRILISSFSLYRSLYNSNFINELALKKDWSKIRSFIYCSTLIFGTFCTGSGSIKCHLQKKNMLFRHCLKDYHYLLSK